LVEAFEYAELNVTTKFVYVYPVVATLAGSGELVIDNTENGTTVVAMFDEVRFEKNVNTGDVCVPVGVYANVTVFEVVGVMIHVPPSEHVMDVHVMGVLNVATIP